MNSRYFGLADGVRCSEGEDADDVWRQLHDEAGKSDPKYFGFHGARTRFLIFFPNGFHSDGYGSQERDYKLAAKTKLDETAPLEKAVDGTGFGEAVLAVFRATNMLSPFEKTRLQDVLRGAHADDFVRAAARFTLDGSKSNLLAMEQALKPHDNAKWTVATYLPYLWRPDTHMFLKPEATKDFATRVGHRFVSEYEPRLSLPVYESLLDLIRKTEQELADMRPLDRIDIQSFIWVVGDYKEGREAIYE
ncbi:MULTISPECIES: hypothetical protein [unclassified Rhizobium]|uniref:hypothetical protein n=1 Tax=unclassified Rhizobium TaxID=2613769 RepID=UPI002B26278D|nr:MULTISPECIES: hypothetical protein [unclassified Rhizobium]